MYLSLYTDAESMTGSIVLLSLIILAIIFKRLHLFGSGPFLTLISSFFSIVSFMFGIRCLYLAEKNSYFKYLSYFGSLFVSISFTGLLFKLMHWPTAGILLYFTSFSVVIGTIIVLFTLPSSGYIDWQSLHKKVLRRILIPWSLIFALFIINFLFPGLSNAIWSRSQNQKAETTHFEMIDYNIEQKNGLNPE
jgi:hypothetical protein